MDINESTSLLEINKGIIQRYFEAYNSKNETIFDEIISPDYLDHGQSAYMGSAGLELREQRMTSNIHWIN